MIHFLLSGSESADITQNKKIAHATNFKTNSLKMSQKLEDKKEESTQLLFIKCQEPTKFQLLRWLTPFSVH